MVLLNNKDVSIAQIAIESNGFSVFVVLDDCKLPNYHAYSSF